MPYPRTRAEINALPYKLYYGHWEMSAWRKGFGPHQLLAQVSFPISTLGPFDPPEVQDRLFDELDKLAREALAKIASEESQ